VTPPCPLCAATRILPHHREAGHAYHRCGGCGLVFLVPIPTAEELHRLYEEEVGATFHHGAEISGAFEKRLEARLRLSTVADALRSAPDRRALEIGCGAGYLLDELRGRGWDVAGMEPAAAYVRHARERLRLDVRPDWPEGRRGALLVFNVLSHFPDPEAALRRCLDSLLPGGVLALETGNAAEVPPWRVGHFGAPDHVWHYSEATLRRLLKACGFVDLRVRRFNVEWQRRAIALLGRLRRRPPTPAAAGSAPPAPAAAPAVESLPKKIVVSSLLALRFGAGRVLADRDHFCTVFVTARRPR
jgi:SAM-dependent methyltransferase